MHARAVNVVRFSLVLPMTVQQQRMRVLAQIEALSQQARAAIEAENATELSRLVAQLNLAADELEELSRRTSGS